MDCSLLADLPAEDVRQLLSIARWRAIEKGEVVFHRDGLAGDALRRRCRLPS